MTDAAPTTIDELTKRIEARFDEVKTITEVGSFAPNKKPWMTLTCGIERKSREGEVVYDVGADEAACCAMFLNEFEISAFAKKDDTLYWRIKPELTRLKKGMTIVARLQAE